MAFSIRTPFIIGYIANKAGEIVASPEFIRLLNSIDPSLTTGSETDEGDVTNISQNVVVVGGDSLEPIVQQGTPVYMTLADVLQPQVFEQLGETTQQAQPQEAVPEPVQQQPSLGAMLAQETVGTNFSGDLGGMTTTVVNGIITSVV